MSKQAPRPRGVDVAAALKLGGIVAAVVLAAMVNVLSARHYARWDWTSDKRWSLSPATLETLGAAAQPLDLWIIAGAGDPLEPGLRQIATAYLAACAKLTVHWIDPDRDVAQLAELERRFALESGRAEDGQVATDAVVVVSSGEKHWFLTPKDLVEAADGVRVRPRQERALTQAIRSVQGGDRARLCFAVGHGELSLEPGKDPREGLGAVRDLLEKSNYELASVDATAPGALEPFAGCTVVVLAGPRSPFAPDEANRLKKYLLSGGNLLAALGPTEGPGESGFGSSGLVDVLGPFGVALDDDLVHEADPLASIAETHGEGFFATVKPHPVTASLVGSSPSSPAPRVAVFYARSLRHAPPGNAQPGDTPWAAELLVSSAASYSKTSLAQASAAPSVAPRAPEDASGPFVLAMASERARASQGAPHGPRVVVLGTRFALAEDNWRQPRALHGAAFLVDSAISWLAARPTPVDVPERAEVAAGIRISEGGRDEVRRYVLFLMPLAAVLLGAAVWAYRRSSENTPYTPRPARGRQAERGPERP